MTNEEKYKAIVERASIEGWADDPTFISVMVIVSYLEELKKIGLIDSIYQITDAGARVASICEEFDWKPSNDDILRFVVEMVDEDMRPNVAYMLCRYRDDKDEFVKEVQEEFAKLDEEERQIKPKKKKSAKKKKGKN